MKQGDKFRQDTLNASESRSGFAILSSERQGGDGWFYNVSVQGLGIINGVRSPTRLSGGPTVDVTVVKQGQLWVIGGGTEVLSSVAGIATQAAPLRGEPGPPGPAAPVPDQAQVLALLEGNLTEAALSASLGEKIRSIFGIQQRQDQLERQFGTLAQAQDILTHADIASRSAQAAQSAAMASAQQAQDAQVATALKEAEAAQARADAQGAALQAEGDRKLSESAADKAAQHSRDALNYRDVADSRAQDASGSAEAAIQAAESVSSTLSDTIKQAEVAKGYRDEAKVSSEQSAASAGASQEAAEAAAAHMDAAGSSAYASEESRQAAVAADQSAGRHAQAAQEASRTSAAAQDEAVSAAQSAASSRDSANAAQGEAAASASSAAKSSQQATAASDRSVLLNGNPYFVHGAAGWLRGPLTMQQPIDMRVPEDWIVAHLDPEFAPGDRALERVGHSDTLTEEAYPLSNDQVYRISFKTWSVNGGPGINSGGVAVGAAFYGPDGHTVSHEWQPVTDYVLAHSWPREGENRQVDSSILVSRRPGYDVQVPDVASAFRPLLATGMGTTTNRTHIGEFRVEDVTQALAAQASASFAAQKRDEAVASADTAQQQAQAASEHAHDAQVYAGKGETSARLAKESADEAKAQMENASSAAGRAETFAAGAHTSQENAASYAQAAGEARTSAEAARDAANSSASSALESKESAEALASDALSYAGAAQQDRLDAEAARNAAVTAAGVSQESQVKAQDSLTQVKVLGKNPYMADGVVGWTRDWAGQQRIPEHFIVAHHNPEFAPSGQVIKVTGHFGIFSEYAYPIDPERVYRIRTVSWSDQATSNLASGVTFLNSNRDLVGPWDQGQAYNLKAYPRTPGARIFTHLLLSKKPGYDIQIPPNASFFRAMTVPNWGSPTDWTHVSQIIVEDVTAELQAAQSAEASRQSAVTANTKAGEAQNAAGEAQGAAGAAQNAAGTAQDAAGAASQHREDARVFASNSQTSAQASEEARVQAVAAQQESGRLANAAADSSRTAGGFADAAQSRANAAQESAVKASSSLKTQVLTFGNPDFSAGGVGWTCWQGDLSEPISGFEVVNDNNLGTPMRVTVRSDMLSRPRAVQAGHRIRARLRAYVETGVREDNTTTLALIVVPWRGTERLHDRTTWLRVGNYGPHSGIVDLQDVYTVPADVTHLEVLVPTNYAEEAVKPGSMLVGYAGFTDIESESQAADFARASFEEKQSASGHADASRQSAEASQIAQGKAETAQSQAHASEQTVLRVSGEVASAERRASTAAGDAEGAASRASTSADQASTSAGNAAASESRASTYAGNAAGSAQTALEQASAAAGSAQFARNNLQASVFPRPERFLTKRMVMSDEYWRTRVGGNGTVEVVPGWAATLIHNIPDSFLTFSEVNLDASMRYMISFKLYFESEHDLPGVNPIMFYSNDAHGFHGDYTLRATNLDGSQVTSIPRNRWFQLTFFVDQGTSNAPDYWNNGIIRDLRLDLTDMAADGKLIVESISCYTAEQQSASKAEFSQFVNNYYAESTIKVEYGNVIAGIGLRADSGGGAVGVIADRFFVTQPGIANKHPFVVRDGQVQIDGNLITKGSIQTDQLLVRGSNMVPDPEMLHSWSGNLVESASLAPGAPTMYARRDAARDLIGTVEFPVKEGEIYQVSAHFTSVGGSNAFPINMGLVMTKSDGNKAWVPGITIAASKLTEGRWQRYTGRVKVPAGAVRASFWSNQETFSGFSTIGLAGADIRMGETVIDGEQITTGRIVAANGTSFFDLSNGSIRVGPAGGNNLSYDSGTGLLTLNGKVVKNENIAAVGTDKLTGNAGSITGSLIGSGINGNNITVGTISAARLDLSGVMTVGAPITNAQLPTGGISGDKFQDSAPNLVNDPNLAQQGTWNAAGIFDGYLGGSYGRYPYVNNNARYMHPHAFSAVTPGETLRAECHVYSGSSNLSDIVLYIQCATNVNGANGTMVQAARLTRNQLPGNSWTYLGGTATVPAGYTHARFVIETLDTGYGYSTVYSRYHSMTQPRTIITSQMARTGKLVASNDMSEIDLNVGSMRFGPSYDPDMTYSIGKGIQLKGYPRLLYAIPFLGSRSWDVSAPGRMYVVHDFVFPDAIGSLKAAPGRRIQITMILTEVSIEDHHGAMSNMAVEAFEGAFFRRDATNLSGSGILPAADTVGQWKATVTAAVFPRVAGVKVFHSVKGMFQIWDIPESSANLGTMNSMISMYAG